MTADIVCVVCGRRFADRPAWIDHQDRCNPTINPPEDAA